MNDLSIFILLGFVGTLAGFLAGLLGIGGGVIFVPALIFILPMLNSPEPVIYYALGTSLFAGIFSALSSFYNHYKIGNVDLKAGLMLSAGSIPFALIIPQLTVQIDSEIIKYIVGSVLFLVTIKFLFEKEEKQNFNLDLNRKWMFAGGATAGSFSGLTGLGGGILFVPMLSNLFSVKIKKAVGTAAIAVAFTMLSSTISFLFTNNNAEANSLSFGYVNLFAGMPLGLLAIAGAKLGVKFHSKVPAAVLKKIFSIFLLIVILKLIFF